MIENNKEQVTKIYGVINEKNEYVHYFKYPTCVFDPNRNKAEVFPTYSKANTFAKRVNKFYGYKRVKVATIIL